MSASANYVPWWKEPTREQWLAWWAAWLGWTLDAFDFTIFLLIMVVGIVLDVVLRDWMLPHYALDNATAGQAWAAVWAAASAAGLEESAATAESADSSAAGSAPSALSGGRADSGRRQLCVPALGLGRAWPRFERWFRLRPEPLRCWWRCPAASYAAAGDRGPVRCRRLAQVQKTSKVCPARKRRLKRSGWRQRNHR